MKVIEREVIVVGAGPGGSTCASYLAREGIDVLLMDKETFPRDKPCGDSQAEVTVKHVTELGAIDELRKYGYRNKGFLLTSPCHEKAYLSGPGERYTTPRKIFDNIMKNTAVRHGAEMLEDCWVYDVIKEDGVIQGVKAKYQGEYVEFRSKVVIGADGSHSMVAKAMGMFPENLKCVGTGLRSYFMDVPTEGYLEIHFDKNVLPGYFYIFPSGQKGGVNVGMGINLDVYNDKTLEEYIHIFAETSPFGKRLLEGRRVSPWKGWRLATAPQRYRNYAAGAMLIGDAGSMVRPLIGEGVGPATETGKMAADTAMEALKANDFSENTLKKYDERIHRTYDASFQAVQNLDDAFRSPVMINGLVHKYNTDDAFKKQVYGMMFLDAK